MKWRICIILLTTIFLSGCTSIFSSSSPPRMAYVGDLSNNRVARAGETIAYAKSDSGDYTTAYIFKGVDSKGGIHVYRKVQPTNPEGKRSGLVSMLTNNTEKSIELVFMPEQTLLVSAGVHVVFIRSAPGELHYRVVMT